MIESWDISYSASLKVAINPLLAIKDKALPEGTFMHSDQGGLYSTLKSELLYNPLIIIRNDIEMVNALADYLNYYNNERIQKKLGYLTPAQYKKIRLEVYQRDTK